MSDSATEEGRRYPRRPLLAASAAVFQDGCVLIAQRAVPPLTGYWSLPGGLVEPGEALAAAAAREVLEETGIVAEMTGPADVVEVIRADDLGRIEHHYVIIAFAGTWRSGTARAGEATSDVRWVHPAELSGLTLTAGTAEVVRKAARLLA